ncbi:hypothetical protein V8G54_024362 [Vigna mungo]|uniref:Uncharacterized protein n=1 Tax=Vigna mungo TaxID=3915 RepID=A0AAQ3RTE0_VIGMU
MSVKRFRVSLKEWMTTCFFLPNSEFSLSILVKSGKVFFYHFPLPNYLDLLHLLLLIRQNTNNCILLILHFVVIIYNIFMETKLLNLITKSIYTKQQAKHTN